MEKTKVRGSLKVMTWFAAALLVGALAVKAQARGPWGDRSEGTDRVEFMAKIMDLSPEQESKIKAILDENQKKRDELWAKEKPRTEAMRAEMDKLREESKASIESLLNDRQREKFRALNDYRGRGRFTRGGSPCGGAPCDETALNNDDAPCGGPCDSTGPGAGRRCWNQ